VSFADQTLAIIIIIIIHSKCRLMGFHKNGGMYEEVIVGIKRFYSFGSAFS
jgi:hypothetical protein